MGAPVAKMEKEVADKGGRRQGIDRRQVDIDEAVEEDQREKKERRSGVDRRKDWSYKDDPTERRESFTIK
jgi:hypothetical protein